MSLEHFHQAQADQRAGYATALAEIRKGRKSSHWIWYVCPQLDGLGHSSTARSYALRGLAEACAYLRDPLLGRDMRKSRPRWRSSWQTEPLSKT